MAIGTGITAVAPCRHCDAMISVIAEICRALHSSRCVRRRFYVDKTATGLLQLVTLGGLGLWMLYDLVLIVTGQFRDAHDKPVTEEL